jgi:hypothetical protein
VLSDFLLYLNFYYLIYSQNQVALDYFFIFDLNIVNMKLNVEDYQLNVTGKYVDSGVTLLFILCF